MRHSTAIRGLFLCVTLLVVRGSAQEIPQAPDRTLSPYLLIKTDDPGLDQLPLKGISAEVEIAGVIADVRITQLYQNEGEPPAYSFDIRVDLAAGMPIRELICTSHDVEIEHDGSSLASVRLGEGEEEGGTGTSFSAIG